MKRIDEFVYASLEQNGDYFLYSLFSCDSYVQYSYILHTLKVFIIIVVVVVIAINSGIRRLVGDGGG